MKLMASLEERLAEAERSEKFDQAAFKRDTKKAAHIFKMAGLGMAALFGLSLFKIMRQELGGGQQAA
jgi:hypothetical protein